MILQSGYGKEFCLKIHIHKYNNLSYFFIGRSIWQVGFTRQDKVFGCMSYLQSFSMQGNKKEKGLLQMRVLLSQERQMSLSDSAIKDRIKEATKLINNYEERQEKIQKEIQELQKQFNFTPTKEELKKPIDYRKLDVTQLLDREKVLKIKLIQVKSDEMDIITELKKASEELERKNI